MALATRGAGEDGGLGTELIAQDAKALIGDEAEFDLVASDTTHNDLYRSLGKELTDRGPGVEVFH
jgi:hypothetical protein